MKTFIFKEVDLPKGTDLIAKMFKICGASVNIFVYMLSHIIIRTLCD